MSNELQEAFDELVLGTSALEAFPFDDFANRLHNKVRACIGTENNSDAVQKYIERAPNYPPEDSDSDSSRLDGFEAYDLLYRLSLPAASHGIASVDGSLDSDNLRRFISADNSKLRYLESLTNLMSFCLGEHVDFQLRSQGKRDLNELYHIDGFKEYVLEQIVTDEFITNEIRRDIARGNHLFSIVWLLLADYFENREFAFRNSPASGPDFENKASHKTLSRWSYTLWATEGKGNPDRMDEVVTFCGKVATISICPPNSTTGLQRPTSVTTVMKSFYSQGMKAPRDDAYTKELQNSLDRLSDNEEIINEWKSYCDTLASSWEIQVRHYWNKAFFHLFQEGQSREVKFWIATASDAQWNLYLWDSYLPVLGNPYDKRSIRTPGCHILPGTLITFSDGESRMVEDVSPAHRILTQVNPNKSATAVAYPVDQPVKTKLMRLNGEGSFFPSSQVFHTPTGLRAADPEAAQILNPFQRIGQLDVGHIVFRLQGEKYEAVEVKAIEQTKETTLDRVYTLALPGDEQTLHVHGYLVETNAPGHTLRQTINALRKVPGSRRLGVLSHCKEMWPMFKKFDSQCINQRLNWELFGQYKSPDGKSPKVKRSVSFRDQLKTEKALSRPTGVAIDGIARGFALTAHHPSNLPAGYELPTLSLVDGYLLVQGEVQLRSTYDSQDRSFHWTRELKQQNLFEHGSVQIDSRAISGNGVIYVSSESEAQAMPDRHQLHPFVAHAQSLESLHTAQQASDETWKYLSTYNVTLDQSPWPADTERTEPVDPVDGGTFEDGYLVSSANVKTRALRLPLVEQLREQINQKFNQKLGTFYKAISQFNTDGLETFKVVFSRAPLVPFVSDAGLDLKRKFSVGFESDLDIDVTLPTLFQQMNITFDVRYKTFTGYFFEYDPTKRGYKGDRHLVTGTAKPSSAADTIRSRVSQAYASVYKPGVTASLDETFQPAPVTKSLLKAKQTTIDDLMELSGYQETSLHNGTQQYIQQMMYYHMDDEQREKILREPKPIIGQDIPASLADNLPSKLKTFFKEKYAPAFICRYVGRTQKYSGSFTDQEIKNLWYWWEGNGPNSLSHSEEYNDINRLSSRASMLEKYASQLEPYLNDNPEKWAKDLHTELIDNKHLMEIWIDKPIQNGNNVINKQCNILDALDPGPDWANQFFTEFMAVALEEGGAAANIDDSDQDSQYKWVYDSMSDLIQAILNGDQWVSEDVRAALLQDINDFEEANGLNQQADAEQRAAAILEKSTVFMRELTTWMSYIGKGLQAAFGGSALFKWAGEAFDNVSSKFLSKLPGVAKLKGISSICMAGVSLASAAVSLWGLVENWDSMSDAAKATVIIEVIGMVTDAAGNAIDAFKSFTSKPATTATDQINMEALNESLSSEIRGSNEKLGSVAQEISGPEDFRTAIGDGIHGEGLPMEGGTNESWDQDVSSIAEDIPPGYEDAAKKFNISGNLLRILNIILGIGLVVAMSFSLANDWNSMSDTGKVLGVLNAIVQGLTVLLDIIDFAAEAGVIAVTGTMSVALPILGAVLAVIGIVLMLVQLFINLFVARQPPPDPIQEFIDKVGHALIKTFDQAPEPKLTYSISSTSVSADSVNTLTIEGVNETKSDVTLSRTTITLYSGDDDVCLFRNGADYIQLVPDDDPNRETSGHTYVAPQKITAGQLPTPAKLGTTSNYYQYNLQAAGPPKENSTNLTSLILKHGEKLKSVWTAVANKIGDDKEKSTSWIEVIEAGLKDKTQHQFKITRV
ncbi:Eukaryotic aspartyl protease family protein [Penicillium digitatum]|uniref:Uncharacterized protein n=3 Tax=Penicillium digitatum TaxID=36651 RepID=K9GBD0_PEND2|nr:hypothetical protein PDIP_17270 [Penicillium digitatum Pd1]EKV12208.1 hypothetical protein PDIG_45330 [Penicillium digitatum PHI26]EKV20368.1 hypothetical protein PDIP_17270 [Penicillium digitatum Pd1]QQK45327.1 Eukaryotic aspartyl protease family protein [Penicillium digitatum]